VRARILIFSAAIVCVASAAVCVWLATHDLAQIEAVTGSRVSIAPVFVGLAWAMTGAVLAWLRPRNALGWLLLGVGTFQALSIVTAIYGGYGLVLTDAPLPLARWSAWLGSAIWLPGLLPLANLLLALYPEGRLPSRRWRWPVAAASVGIVMITVALLLLPDAYDDIAPGPPPVSVTLPSWFQLSWTVTMAVLLTGGTLVIWVLSAIRLARSRPPERQQLAWLFFVVLLFVLTVFTPRPWLLGQVGGLLIPVAIAVGVFRYNLLGIEVVLRRGLLYATLTGIVVAVYLAVTAIAGSGLDHSPLPGVAAAALVAVGLTPLRERLQGAVDRLVYGERSDPLGAVTRLGDRVAADEPDLLSAVLAIVTAAVRAPGATVVTADGRLIATHGSPAAGPAFALRVGGIDVGSLEVAARTPGESYTAGDRRLLGALVPQVAVVVRALELAEALEAERDRVVAATRTERNRLRRDLHDGLGPSLSGVRLGLRALHDALAADDRATVTDLLDRIRAEVDTTVGEVRRIIDGFRPAVLDDTGLAGALRRHAVSVSAAVHIDLQVADLPPLPPEVETAAYRIAQEALTNVVRHAVAERAWITLTVADGDLTVEVADNGAGIGTRGSDGVGLASMRQRAEALGGTLAVSSTGGGTTVVATLPFGEPHL